MEFVSRLKSDSEWTAAESRSRFLRILTDAAIALPFRRRGVERVLPDKNRSLPFNSQLCTVILASFRST